RTCALRSPACRSCSPSRRITSRAVSARSWPRSSRSRGCPAVSLVGASTSSPTAASVARQSCTDAMAFRRMRSSRPCSSGWAHVGSERLARSGWGRAVRTGLARATGDLLCYTNWARTAPAELRLTILYAATHQGTVVKANRKIREHWSRRLGSLLYNLECRALFDLSCWDVNGTPKVFPRSCDRLLRLRRDDDLIDAEFVRTCREACYPMLAVPVSSSRRHGGKSTTNLASAFRMYWGAWAMRHDAG